MSRLTITFSRALEGYSLYFDARGLSENTRNDYWNTFRKFQDFLGGEMLVQDISKQDIERFMAEQRHQKRKKKTLLNYHSALSSFWAWAVLEGICEKNIVRMVVPPKPNHTEIIPYTEDEVKAMIKSCNLSRAYSRANKPKQTRHSLRSAERNRAILYVLIDTGIRVTELCTLNRKDINLNTRHIRIQGKGDKERYVPFSAKTGRQIWLYLQTRDDVLNDEPLFANQFGLSLDRNAITRMIKCLGQKADVPNAGAHRFRHTFAINFLRNGGDVFTLQAILGHSSLDMVRRYLKLAKADYDRAHRMASPVSNWRL